MNIAIVGGGIAGLAIGWRLAQSGATVTIVERGLAGKGATWASAGMLAPVAEAATSTTSPSEAHAIFANRSLAMWPSFAREIETASRTDIGYRADGALVVATNASRAAHLSRFANATTKWLSPAEAQKMEAGLGPEALGALHAPNDAHVDNRALGDALLRAASGAGAIVRENCAVISFLVEGDRACGVLTDNGTIRADKTILTAGAWSSVVAGKSSAAFAQIRPVKGQMIAFGRPAGAPVPTRMIWGDNIYLVPRGDLVFAGATVEEAGFDTGVTHAACTELRQRAEALLPFLRAWPLREAWAGLRPQSFDGEPLIGETALADLFIASGQFRNGILLAPAMAEAMCRLLRDDAAGDMADFDPRRQVQ